MVLLSLLLAGSAHTEPVDFAGARIVVSASATDIEVFAAREASRYFRLLCGQVSPVVREAGQASAVFVGVSPEALPRDADEQSYALHVVSTDPPRLRVLGKTPIGVQYGVYSLLERLGVGFYLGGDALPEQRDSLLLPSDLNETGAPVFKIRGSLPWYNFLNSPTTWDLEDYQFFFDQMAKMKMNFVGFHSYDHEPFCAYPEGGQWRMGAPAATSMTYGWGAIRHLQTTDFGFGTGRYFPYDVFGSRSAALAKKPTTAASVTDTGTRSDADFGDSPPLFPHRTAEDDAIVRAQCVLAQGLQYAKWRGVKVCLGFELVGDPTNPEQRRIEEARIRHMLATYPMLDYVWFWQSEGLGGGSNPADSDSPLDLIVQRYRPVFDYLGSENRIHEAARVAAWTQFAYGVVKRLRPDVRVAVSGWGGDRWMRFSDFYVGLDKVLPEDVIFTALDNIDPSWEPNVSAAYRKLSPTREKWPIPWWESDGGGLRRDQWGPQCNVKPFTYLVRDAQAKGCQGILGIHWQTRGVEEVAAYVAQFAWNPNLTYEQFYETFARKCYGEKHGPEMAQIHMRLEALGPRWTGSRGQVECGRFQWFSDDARPKAENLATLSEVLERLRQQKGEAVHWTTLDRQRYLRSTIEFLLAFDEAALVLAPDGPIERLLQQAETAKTAGDEAKARELAEQALQEMRACRLREAMQAYAARLTSQGDFGNLATINVKAYGAFLNLWQRAEMVLGGKQPMDEDTLAGWPVVKLPPTAVPEGTPLTIRAICPRIQEETAPVLVFRRPRTRSGRETSIPMQREGRGLFTATVPGHEVGPEGLELQIQAEWHGSESLAKPAFVWPSPVHWYSISTIPNAGPAVYGPYVHRQVALAPWMEGQADGVTLQVTALSAREYEMCPAVADVGPFVRSATPLYHLAVFPIMGPLPRVAEGLVSVVDGVGRRSRSSVRFAQPNPPASPPSAKAEIAGPYLARVTWDAVPEAATYELHRSAEPNFTPSEKTLIAEWPWTVYDDVGLTPNATYHWAVVAVNDAGMRSGFTRTGSLLVPEQPPAKAPTSLVATPGPGRITLTWQPSPERVSGYAVLMRPDTGGDWKRVSGDAPVKGLTYVVGGLPDTNPRQFAVRAIDRAGREGKTSESVSAAARPIPVQPVLSIAFDSARAETGQRGALGGKATIHDGILDTRQGGWIAFPQEEVLQLAGPLSLEFWINVDQVKGIPVMVSFGHWEGLGYWMQLIGGRIRWYLPVQKILDAGSTPGPGWHHLCGTYDGRFSRLYIDGREVGSKEVGQVDLTPWPGEFRIGMYSDIDEQFQTHAQFDDVRVYQRALSAEEVGKAAQARG